jgi:hypothetical protein
MGKATSSRIKSVSAEKLVAMVGRPMAMASSGGLPKPSECVATTKASEALG